MNQFAQEAIEITRAAIDHMRDCLLGFRHICPVCEKHINAMLEIRAKAKPD